MTDDPKPDEPIEAPEATEAETVELPPDGDETPSSDLPGAKTP